MKKVVTSVTTFATAEGIRLSVTASTLDDTGKIVESNKRYNRVVVDEEILKKISDITEYALTVIEG